MIHKLKMTWIHFIPVISLIFWSAISCKKEEKHKVQLGENAVVKFSFENLKDSTAISLYNLSIFKSSKFYDNSFVLEEENNIEFVIPCEYPSGIYFTVNNSSFTGFLLPKDTLRVNVQLLDNGSVEKIEYSGRTQSICNYYLQKKQHLGYQDLRIPLNKAPAVLDQISINTDTLMRNELNFLKQYTLHTHLPEWFIQTEKSQIIYLCSNYKKSQKALFEKHLNITYSPPKDYYKSIDTLDINNPSAIFSYWYFDFLNSCLVYDNVTYQKQSVAEWRDLTTALALSKANENLTGEIRDVFKYNYLNSYLTQTKDLESYDELFQENKNDFSSTNYLNDLIAKRSLLNDSIVKNRNDAYQQSAKNRLEKNDSIPYFYLPNSSGQFFSPKYFKEKIVYVNFWATWCKPCIASIPQKNDLIMAYANSPKVVFLNICTSSSKEDWKKMIDEKKIGGINLFANENWSNILINKFGVSGVPTYFLVQDGKVIKPYCDSPENIEDDLKVLLKN